MEFLASVTGTSHAMKVNESVDTMVDKFLSRPEIRSERGRERGYVEHLRR